MLGFLVTLGISVGVIMLSEYNRNVRIPRQLAKERRQRNQQN